MAKRNINLVPAAAASGADDEWVDAAEADELVVRVGRWRIEHPARLPKDPYAPILHTRFTKSGRVARDASGAPAPWAVHEEVMTVPFSQKIDQGKEIKKLQSLRESRQPKQRHAPCSLVLVPCCWFLDSCVWFLAARLDVGTRACIRSKRGTPGTRAPPRPRFVRLALVRRFLKLGGRGRFGYRCNIEMDMHVDQICIMYAGCDRHT